MQERTRSPIFGADATAAGAVRTSIGQLPRGCDLTTATRSSRFQFRGVASLVEQLHPRAHVMAVVVKSPAADQIAVHHAGRVDEGAAADFEVELALRHGCHPAAFHAVGARRNLDTV